MNYVFFDVECANCFSGKGKLCSFGYVVTDELFEIIKEEDIFINPDCEWDWYVLEHIINYPKEFFEDKSKFSEIYSDIKNILEKGIAFGFDVVNDLKYINDDCKRYDLPLIGIKSYDMQMFYKLYAGEKQKKSLFSIAKELNIDLSDVKEHTSKDDAKVTMLVMKKLTELLNIGSKDLLYLCEKSYITSFEPKDPKKDSETLFKENFINICNNYPDRKSKPSICLSDAIKESDANKRLNFIKLIFEKGYNYTSKVSECTFFVTNGIKGVRDEAFEYNISQGKAIKRIDLEELGKMLDVTLNQFGEVVD